MDLVSICIPVYNAEKYLALAIQSVLDQTYGNFELILINDGSTDNSLNIINHFAQIDGRIKVLNDGENKGLIYRLNQSIMLSKGEYYARMDADDVMFPNRIELQIKVMKEDTSIDLVHGAAVSINNKSEILGFRSVNEASGIGVIHPTVLAKKKFYLENKYEAGYPQMEDLELWYRTHKRYKFKGLNIPLIFYREDSIDISGKHKRMLPGLKKFVRKNNFDVVKSCKLILTSKLKYYTYLLAECLNIDGIIIKRRYSKLTIEERLNYKSILEGINV